jgi:hypothetical protein
MKALWDDINHLSLSATTSLHWLCILILYIPKLSVYNSDLTNAFEGSSIATQRLPSNRKTVVQPLRTNGEREVEIHSMDKALRDFDHQMMVTKENAKHSQLLWWYCGDSATHGIILKLQHSHCTLPDDYASHRFRLSTPEVWHTRATVLNSIATNHFGPDSCLNPSSLSRLCSILSFKIPSETSSDEL